MATAKSPKQKTYVDEFRDRIAKLEKDAQGCGLNLTEVCRQAGVSRATPDRWRKQPPKTIRLLAKMEQIVAREVAAAAKSA